MQGYMMSPGTRRGEGLRQRVRSPKLSAQNQPDVDVPAGCIGVRANLMCGVDQAFDQLPVKAWQADLQLDIEAEPARDLADTDVGGNRGGRGRPLTACR